MSDVWQRTYDVFVSHAWRYHDDWQRFCDVMNAFPRFRWRNFSVPWYDPAIDVNTERGKRLVLDSLEAQIIPCHAAVAPDSVLAIRSARRWIEEGIRIARAHGKPVLGLPAFGATQVSAELAALVDRSMVWDAEGIAQAIIAAANPPAGAISR